MGETYNGFIKTADEILVKELKRHGFVPFGFQQGVYMFVKSDKLVSLLATKYGGINFFVDDKLTF